MTVARRVQAVMQAIPGMRTVSGPGGQPLVSVAQMVIDSVNATDVDLRKELFAGVVLTGTLPLPFLPRPAAQRVSRALHATNHLYTRGLFSARACVTWWACLARV